MENQVKIGRPSIYSEELGLKISNLMIEGMSLRKICALDEFPERKTVYNWLSQLEHPFLHHYTHAREVQAETYAEEIIDLSDEASVEDVNVKRLQVDARKWVSSKLLPKKYGEKTFAEMSGANGTPLIPEALNETSKLLIVRILERSKLINDPEVRTALQTRLKEEL